MSKQEIDPREIPDKQGRTGTARGGRPAGKKSSRTPRQRKLAEVLNKFDPILADAIDRLAEIVKADPESSKVTPTTQLQAIKLIVDKVIELRNECYKPDTASGEAPQDDDGEEETGAVLSFTVVDGKK